MKGSILGLSLAVVLVFTASATSAQTTIVVTPESAGVFGTGQTGQPEGGNQVVGVAGDSAPGFSFGSFASNGVLKTDMYFPPEMIFGREVTVGEVASMSYWTKKGTTHAVDPKDWYLILYTKPYAGQLGGGWYGVRLGLEPYYAMNMADPAGEWNQWSTSAGANQLRAYESTYNYFGSYSDPSWETLQGMMSKSGSRGPGVAYAEQRILAFSIHTASNWSDFVGQLDGFEIHLNDGSSVRVNFEPFAVATDKEQCKDGGWTSLRRADGTGFKNQGACVSYTNTGR
ncbi:MAG: hypothetical protein Q8L86_18130 [Vicinamibacterales bacterium]|nr:hypothetical protein [Vicinamibacterales bacterium]